MAAASATLAVRKSTVAAQPVVAGWAVARGAAAQGWAVEASSQLGGRPLLGIGGHGWEREVTGGKDTIPGSDVTVGRELTGGKDTIPGSDVTIGRDGSAGREATQWKARPQLEAIPRPATPFRPRGSAGGQEHRQPLRRADDRMAGLRQPARQEGFRDSTRNEGSAEGGDDTDEEERAGTRGVLLRTPIQHVSHECVHHVCVW